MWKHKSELFMLGEDGELAVVAGVPPDAFSKDGQLWGNPVYDYEKMKKDGYAWWKARIDYALDLFDYVRIDHFRGFDRFFAVPSGEQTAKNGEWLDGPKAELFKGREHLGIIAEDLGLIDEGVVKLMRDTGFPGMKVLSFGFNGDEWSEHKPSNYSENCVAYTGTHDNAPLCGMIADLGGTERAVLESDLKRECEKLGVYYHALTDKDICQTYEQWCSCRLDD
jgi:4-alpha-glucanotransferase